MDFSLKQFANEVMKHGFKNANFCIVLLIGHYSAPRWSWSISFPFSHTFTSLWFLFNNKVQF